jgi:DNA-binding transcriptional ArsR family regulator
MANRMLKEKVLKERIENQTSYSELKKKFGVSKSTLSGWLKDFPLSEKRINELQANSPQRIERYRNTMKKKDDEKKDLAYQKISKMLGNFSEREILIAGMFLYWAEGGKTQRSGIALTNTNPDMLIFFIKWMKLFEIEKSSLKVKIHIYSDMDAEKQVNFWSEKLGLKKSQFYKPYIKQSKFSSITYKNGFGQGTCCVMASGRKIADLVLMGIKYISSSVITNI